MAVGFNERGCLNERGGLNDRGLSDRGRKSNHVEVLIGRPWDENGFLRAKRVSRRGIDWRTLA